MARYCVTSTGEEIWTGDDLAGAVTAIKKELAAGLTADDIVLWERVPFTSDVTVTVTVTVSCDVPGRELPPSGDPAP